MGHKINPIANRLGINRTWTGQWYAEFRHQQYARWLTADLVIQQYLKRALRFCGVSSISIVRLQNPKEPLTINIKTSLPGVVIGQGASRIKSLETQIKKLLCDRKLMIRINVETEPKPHWQAAIVVQTIARDLENRLPFRRAQKYAIQKSLDDGVAGIKTLVTGRLGGADIARSEKYLKGKMPLATLRYDIDYAMETAMTTYGVIGVKVWIARGPVYRHKKTHSRYTDPNSHHALT